MNQSINDYVYQLLSTWFVYEADYLLLSSSWRFMKVCCWRLAIDNQYFRHLVRKPCISFQIQRSCFQIIEHSAQICVSFLISLKHVKLPCTTLTFRTFVCLFVLNSGIQIYMPFSITMSFSVQKEKEIIFSNDSRAFMSVLMLTERNTFLLMYGHANILYIQIPF
jgi:hypothetical protein